MTDVSFATFLRCYSCKIIPLPHPPKDGQDYGFKIHKNKRKMHTELLLQDKQEEHEICLHFLPSSAALNVEMKTTKSVGTKQKPEDCWTEERDFCPSIADLVSSCKTFCNSARKTDRLWSAVVWDMKMQTFIALGCLFRSSPFIEDFAVPNPQVLNPYTCSKAATDPWVDLGIHIQE